MSLLKSSTQCVILIKVEGTLSTVLKVDYSLAFLHGFSVDSLQRYN